MSATYLHARIKIISYLKFPLILRYLKSNDINMNDKSNIFCMVTV